MTLIQCKAFLDDEKRYRSELKSKFMQFEVPEERFEEAMTIFDKPDFVKLANMLSKGEYINSARL